VRFSGGLAPTPLFELGPYHEEGRIHEVLAGDMVRSKSEVIVANLLTAARIKFDYEVPIVRTRWNILFA
jgi:exodeoxyribonuclease V alpha subunit